MATHQVRVALVLQRDPDSEDPPASSEDVEPIAVDARIVKAVRQDGGFALVLKGIARLQVRDLDNKGELPVVVVAPVETGPTVRGGHAALRRFAKFDPLVREEAGTALLSQVDVLDIGSVADLVAKAADDGDLTTRALLTVDPVQRAGVVEKALGM